MPRGVYDRSKPKPRGHAYICKYCGHKSSEAWQHAQHVKLIHPSKVQHKKQGTAKCQFCGKKFKPRGLTLHITQAHGDQTKHLNSIEQENQNNVPDQSLFTLGLACGRVISLIQSASESTGIAESHLAKGVAQYLLASQGRNVRRSA